MGAGDAGPRDGRPEDFVQSVGRAVRVLEVVGREPGLPVKAIARKCDLNISTSYHLVRTLAYEGYLVRLPNGTYVIGESVARRFHDLLTSLERPPAAAPVLRHLSDRVGLSSYLGLLHEERVTVVEVAEAPGSPYLEDFEVGLDVSAHATALGKALLAELTPPEVERLLPAKLAPLTPHTVTSRRTLLAELDSTRQFGWARECEQNTPGVACVAASVPYRIPATDAISCSMPLARASEKELTRVAEAVREHCEQLAQTLRREGIR
jgi:DNA-binding IclR family transcriptional regulator